ncbi:phosphatidylglycerol lysyltransferase domain-containing protein [Actinoplanes sichuanensis]|uniref:Phosphatidylglycerol lysyltransferase domain-containing protein n=1 Tax=Actinoplanes sichuanensis TaxID=512349 RepID=A0ABW4AML4_9ACTN|nr:phosphatidylglycerol lysyltransferase domain-containing protein [Actinoplanes sichuanensis]BEL08459.1 phosphatidylglycerol lysyltransferase domain-containing protein [Actinoplanes sichuanensis]
MARKRAVTEERRRWDWRSRVPMAFGMLYAVVGVLGILAAVGTVGKQLAGDASLWTGLPAMTSAASGILYLIVARGLSRREHTAWVWLVSLLTLQIVLAAAGIVTDTAHPMRHGATLRIGISALLLAVAVAAGSEFTTGRRRPRRSTTVLLVSLVAVGPLAGWLMLTLFSPGTSTGGLRRAWCGVWFLVRWLVGIRQPHFEAAPPAWIPFTVGLAGATAVVLAAWLSLRPSRPVTGDDGDAATRVRELLATHGDQDSLGYFALRPDKAAVFSPSGKAAVCYRLVNGVSLAAGDPIGAASEWPGAIEAWQEEAIAHGWTPAVLGAGPAGARAYARAGLRVLEIGDEAILNAGEFTLEGRPMRTVRQAVQRVRRAGYRVRVHRVGDVAPSTMEELAGYAERWRDGRTERGFSMALGRFAHPDDLEYVVVEARDAQDRPVAVLGFVPWGAGGLSLDLMRRDPDGPNGLIEFMIVELLAMSATMGVQRLSLNFAMFRSVFARGERLGAGPFLRWWYGVLKMLSRWWQLESLYRANQKYQPTWQPRFICYPKGRSFPKVVMAAAVAEGFVTAPSLRRTIPPAPRRLPAELDRKQTTVGMPR